MTTKQSLKIRIRKHVGAVAIEHALGGFARVSRLHPRARLSLHGVERIRDVAYRRTGSHAHLLDVYRPIARPIASHLPVVLYVHGGAFRMLSKDSHWLMALAFARRGHLVFNINYRLAPKHRFPAAIEDVCAAYAWVVENAARWGGDATRIVVAGESAGANLVTSLTIATTYHRREPWARAAFDMGVVPRATLPACGMFQVSDPARFARRRKLPAWTAEHIDVCSEGYLPKTAFAAPHGLDLADPLLVFERGDRPLRPLPPFFIIAGTHDPIFDDSRRLHAALGKVGAESELAVYPGEVHAFHALVWRPAARDAWRRMLEFVEKGDADETLSRHETRATLRGLP
ncbi:MAG: alpha/beta hydrolase [Deltaproteobacteria bacterium]|nr:alpha/beta hydrolase [Deltaproteobacteria bacterium]